MRSISGPDDEFTAREQLKHQMYLVICQIVEEVCPGHSVFRLRKPVWDKCHSLRMNGYKQSAFDRSLFTKHQGEEVVIILIYVDDLLITGSCSSLINDAKTILHSKFKVKDLGTLRYFLGIEVSRSKKGILLNLRKYALELISETGLSGARHFATPIGLNQKLTTVEYDTCIGKKGDSELEDKSAYQRLIGRLLYLTITRPDISFPVQTLSQFMQKPKQSHMEAALRVVRYIKGAPGMGLLMEAGSIDQLSAYCDSDGHLASTQGGL
ncbi:PREDICTED: uncharacterized protein LOC109236995 [Nicotiana attenuata]|uniref:uncharacterized protein LOC109236995 n=1 Tax=Nicotiana attenuata TaxID=49451 RepID=UPI000904BDC2|nr:PREDICTED: uncharacterized protein LOC109236995 [Nicotiana attenuata]